MMKSPMHPYYEIHDYKFDPQVDFAKFLKEAKTESGIDAANQQEPCVELGVSRRKKKKKKKSWRRWLFSWLKADKKTTKSPILNEVLNNSYHISTNISKPTTRCYGSGPLNGGGGCNWRPSRSASSSPLLGLFNLTKKIDEEKGDIPYVCIQNRPSVRSYGPVYLVT